MVLSSPFSFYIIIFYKSINFNIIHLHNFSKGGGLIKPTETFNLLITLQGHKDENVGEELLGTEEIELILQNYETMVNIKESNFPNVILIDLIMDPLEAVKIIANSPTTVISKVVPIETVVRTKLDSILEKVVNLAGDKVSSGDSFNLICDLRGRKYIKSKDELLDRISGKLIEKFNLSLDGKDSDWVVQLEVVGENTGISILSPDKILKKI
jgi:tRNA acetyltransferase TAN1